MEFLDERVEGQFNEPFLRLRKIYLSHRVFFQTSRHLYSDLSVDLVWPPECDPHVGAGPGTKIQRMDDPEVPVKPDGFGH